MHRHAHNAPLAAIGALLLVTTHAATPALANGVASGSIFDLSVADFPDRVYLGDTLEGTATISMHDIGSRSPQLVQLSVVVETPLGRATMVSRTIRINPGETRTLHVAFPVSEDARTGDFTFALDATAGNETLSVTHSIYVLGGK